MPTLQSINASASPEVQMNQNFFAVAAAALFGRKDSTTAGLTLGYYGGIIGGIGTFATIADGTVALTGSATNYIEATTAGVVSANTSAFTAGRQPLYTAVTSSTAITTLTDYRVILPSMSTGSVTYSTLTLATGTITADTPALSITQTWNNAGVNFIAADTNITNTASGASSMLHRWRVGGAVKASIDYLGAMVLAAGLTLTGAIAGATTIAASGAITATSASPQLTLGVLNTTSGGIKFFGSTSGNVTLVPNVAAGASVTVTLPATSVTLNAAGDLTGTTLAAGVVTSSLTTVGALNSGSITSGFGSIDVGADAISGGAGSFTTLTASGISSIGSGNSFATTLNVGLTPPAVNTIFHSFVGVGVITSQDVGQTDYGHNFYYATGYKYRSSSYAQRISFNESTGDVAIWTAPSGTTGNAITWTSRLNISNTGAVTIPNLAGTGTRTVVVDANGVLSAP